MNNEKEESEENESVAIESILESRTSSKSEKPQYDVSDLAESREKSDLTVKIVRLFSINGLSYLIGIFAAAIVSLFIGAHLSRFIFPPDFQLAAGREFHYTGAQRARLENLMWLIAAIGTVSVSAIGYKLKSEQFINSIQIIGISLWLIISILTWARSTTALLIFNLIVLIPLLYYFNYYKREQ